MKKQSLEAKKREWNAISEIDARFAMFPIADVKKAEGQSAKAFKAQECWVYTDLKAGTELCA